MKQKETCGVCYYEAMDQMSKDELRQDFISRRRALSVQTCHEAGYELAEQLAAGQILDYLRVFPENSVQRRTVAAFVSMKSEIWLDPLLQSLLDQGLRVLVPKLGSGKELGWGELSSLEDLHDVSGKTKNGEATNREMKASIEAQLDIKTISVDDINNANVHKTAVTNESIALNGFDDSSQAHRAPRAVQPFKRAQEPMGTSLGGEAIEQAGVIFIPALSVDMQGHRLGWGGGWYDRVLQYAHPHALRVAIVWPWEVCEQTLPHEPHDQAVHGVLTPNGYTLFEK